MENQKPNALIVGGSSGLGLELARLLTKTHNVTITGRHDPNESSLKFRNFDVGVGRDADLDVAMVSLSVNLRYILDEVEPIDLLIYAAGFYQEANISQLEDHQILNIVNLGLIVPAMLLGRIIRRQSDLSNFIAITSTSQWTPRPFEPVYTAVKAGLAMLANSVSSSPYEDVGKVMVAAPAGMKTAFWRNQGGHDISTMLDPKWVAEQILHYFLGSFKYKFIKILRNEPRVEVADFR